MQMLDLQNKLLNLQRENVQVSQEKGSLKNELLLLEEKSRMLEEENSSFCMEVVSLDTLSVFFRNSLYEKCMELKAVAEDVYQLNGANFAVNQRLNLTEMTLDDMLIKKGMELQQLKEEHEKAKKLQSEASRSEQQLLIQETELWEKQASMFFDEVQFSSVCQIVHKQKLLELAEACDRFVGENTSKESCINHLSETVGALTSQNGNLKAQFAAYGHAISSLKQCISFLEKSEKQPLSRELKDAENGNEIHDISVCSKEDVTVLDPISDLQDLQRRIRSIGKAAVEREQLLVQENAKIHAELDSAMKQIAELKSDSSLHRRRPGSETSYNGLFTKDIVLDQVSESSQYVRSKREHAESWESADIDCSTDLKVSKDNMVSSLSTEKQANFHRTKSVKKQNSNRPSLDAMVEKELGVDKQEISKRSTEPQKEGQRKRALERLSSDVQKLANLQMTIEELRRKLKIIDTSKKGKSMEECEILKEQLEEADAAILKLFDLNAKLLKNVDGTPLSAHSKSSMETDESGSAKGWRISEQARRMSEKIGRLQMEVQKIEFVLLKLEAENNSKGKNRFSEARRRVLLKDYLYGSGVKSANKGKKSALCCIRPQTNGD